jgi:predicted PurR-regulated permease PerM
MNQTSRMQWTSLALVLIALLLVLKYGLLAALISGLLVYHLVEMGARRLGRIGIIPATGKVMLLVLLVVIVVTLIALGVLGIESQLAQGPESLAALLQKMADVVAAGRPYLPTWIQNYLPATLEEWQVMIANWLRNNAGHFSVLGKEAGITLVHIIVGMVVGGIVALDSTPASRAPLAEALNERMIFLARAFGRIVFSQVRISALNTVLSGIFLLGVLPAIGTPLPLAETLVVVTFVAGLLPIVGNLISNTVIFLVALSVSTGTAVLALTYLIVIHKLEYFINARIIGAQINARAWEILLALLTMEAMFGLPGVVAAPIYYAYLKDELAARKLV